MKPLKRAIIRNCPHGGKHNGRTGYVVDTYADGTSSVDMGHNICCITSGWQEIEHFTPGDLIFSGAEVEANSPTAPTGVPEKKRRGRPPKNKESVEALVDRQDEQTAE